MRIRRVLVLLAAFFCFLALASAAPRSPQPTPDVVDGEEGATPPPVPPRGADKPPKQRFTPEGEEGAPPPVPPRSDKYVESSSTVYEVEVHGFVENVSNAIGGVITGWILIAVSLTCLFWNEGRSAHRAAALNEAATSKGCIHVQGQISLPEGSELVDEDSGTRVPNAIRLRRSVEVWQWIEKTKSHTQKQLGGSSRTVKETSYVKEWSSTMQNSNAYKKPPQPANPARPPVEPFAKHASNVSVGEYLLSDEHVQRVDVFEPLPLSEDAVQQLSNQVGVAIERDGGDGRLFVGQSRNNPRIGDARVTYEVVKPCKVSILCAADGQRLRPFKAAGGHTVDLLEVGSLSASELISGAQSSNATMTWTLRIGGFLLLWLAVQMTAGPLVAVADVIPLIGDIVAFGVSSMSFLLCLAIATTVIAIAWLFYRPLFALGLFAVAGACGAALKVYFDQKNTN